MGIKGQYLIFDDGRVLNIRKHQAYVLEFSVLNEQTDKALTFDF